MLLELSFGEPDLFRGGTAMCVTFISPQFGNLPNGSPVTQEPHIYQYLDKVRGDKKIWIQGHLLNQNIGGKGNDLRNLTTLTYSANSRHFHNVENLINTHYNNLPQTVTIDNGEYILGLRYEVIVDYPDFPDPSAPTLFEGLLARKLKTVLYYILIWNLRQEDYQWEYAYKYMHPNIQLNANYPTIKYEEICNLPSYPQWNSEFDHSFHNPFGTAPNKSWKDEAMAAYMLLGGYFTLLKLGRNANQLKPEIEEWHENCLRRMEQYKNQYSKSVEMLGKINNETTTELTVEQLGTSLMNLQELLKGVLNAYDNSRLPNLTPLERSALTNLSYYVSPWQKRFEAEYTVLSLLSTELRKTLEGRRKVQEIAKRVESLKEVAKFGYTRQVLYI